MTNTHSKSKQSKSRQQTPPSAPPACASKVWSFAMLSPADKARACQLTKALYLDLVGEDVVQRQFAWFVEDKTGLGAKVFVGALKEWMQPRDAIEEMLVLQMAWTHARLARLSSIAPQQDQTNNVRVVNDACDRAANTFRRMMLALVEYRRPPRSDSFVAIRQANVANQQVIANGQNQNPAKPISSNELGSTPAKALPPHTEGIDFVATVGPAEQAVGMEHRPQDSSGEKPRQDECHETR